MERQELKKLVENQIASEIMTKEIRFKNCSTLFDCSCKLISWLEYFQKAQEFISGSLDLFVDNIQYQLIEPGHLSDEFIRENIAELINSVDGTYDDYIQEIELW